MATIRNVTFPKAYCVQLQKIISIYEVKEYYFDQDNIHFNIKYDYTCPDTNCRAKMTPINAYKIKKPAQALHFRKLPSSEHENCTYKNIMDNPDISEQDAESQIKKKLQFDIPNKFLLNRPSRTSNGESEAGSKMHTPDAMPSHINRNTNYGNKNSDTQEHATTQLERLVDVFINPLYTSEFIRKNKIRLTLPDGISRYFDNCFKHVKWFQREEAPFIFYDALDEIKTYGKGYKIFLSTKIFDIEKEKPVARKISIYISPVLIQQYRFRNQFLTSINEIIGNRLESSTTVYFTGVYPTLVPIPGTNYYTYSIELQSLAHLLLVNNMVENTDNPE